MEQGTWFFILKFLPYVAFCSVATFLLGLLFGRPKQGKLESNATTPNKATADEAARVKKLQEKLQQAEADARGLRQELTKIKTDFISADEHGRLKSDVDSVRAQLETEQKRSNSLAADLRKAQEISTSLNARLNTEAKSQSNRVIALENELSKSREALNAVGGVAIVSSDDLQAELARAKETATSAIRLVGEARKREASLQQELESLKSQRSERVSEKVGPVIGAVDSKKDATPSPAQRAMEQVREINEKRQLATHDTPAAAVVTEEIITQEPVVELETPVEVAETSETEVTNDTESQATNNPPLEV